MIISLSLLPENIRSDIPNVGVKQIKEIHLTQYPKYMELLVVGIGENDKPFCKLTTYAKKENQDD